jgi:hypothetical protein
MSTPTKVVIATIGIAIVLVLAIMVNMAFA